MDIYRTGTRLANRYEIVAGPAEKRSLLGGMGIVYLCYDHEADRPVALKTFQPQFLPDRAARDRFLREGTTWVTFGHHPHIVHCYGVERLSHGTELFLVLEQVAPAPGKAGASLRDWLQPGQPLPLETALLFALQIARGLAYAGQQVDGFVHRDLKPGNVLVGADSLPGWPVNRVRVTDFGLVAALAGGDPLSGDEAPAASLQQVQLTRGWVGTPQYMAPEQWQGKPVSVATDIYALGLILYELVSGRPATTARSLAGLQEAHCRGALTPLAADTPAEIAALIVRCLALAPAARYQSWTAVETALAAAYRAVSGGKGLLPAPVGAAALDRAERLAAGWAQNSLGASYIDIGQPAVAVGYFERVRAVGQVEEEPELLAAGLGNLGSAYFQLGDARRAIDYYEQSLVIARETGDRVGEGTALGNLGGAYLQLGDARRAIGCFE